MPVCANKERKGSASAGQGDNHRVHGSLCLDLPTSLYFILFASTFKKPIFKRIGRLIACSQNRMKSMLVISG